ncbi:MAG: UbiD family decarboxylase [Gammaproteobacteria bacterium]|jgi:2,5-furandicarboxylate decarboxylase 1|nr:UbiD family decarboxylase [Gammaproteobacteria bacterium]
MSLSFRDFFAALDRSGEVLHVRTPVAARFELAALLKQAEQRDKGIVFHTVANCRFAAVANLMTTPQRLAASLGDAHAAERDRAHHAGLVQAALAAPLPYVVRSQPGACQENVIGMPQVDCTELPVPTFFEHDSGPFLTAAVGVARNPETGALNAGFYRVLVLGPRQLGVSVGPSSDLLKFFKVNQSAGRPTEMALLVGAAPAVLMAAAAKVPTAVSEFDVAGALAGAPLELVQALSVDLQVPADTELVFEVTIDHRAPVPNQMGEFGDLYGTTMAQTAEVLCITHRSEPLFHVIMAGAGKEHNSLGFIILYEIETELRRLLAVSHPHVHGLRVLFDPPSMGMTGEIYLQVAADADLDPAQLARDVFMMKAGRYDVARVIRRIILVDTDIDITQPREINWAVNNRATQPERYHFFGDLPLPGLDLRWAVDALVRPADREKLQRLRIPGAERIKLDDYL